MTHAPSERLSAPIRHVGVVLRRRGDGIPAVVERLAALCEAHGVTPHYESHSAYTPEGARRLDLDAQPVDLLLALGGDGTMLRAARLGMSRRIPVFGVNLGRLGFLTTTPVKDLETRLAQVFAGEAQLDRRLTLQATVVGPDGEAIAGPFPALNDIVVHTAGAARVTALQLTVGRGEATEEIGSISADGVILTSPTGSTAYSLSAGGPIITPGVECLVVTAICPHSLAVRPLVVSASERITVGSLDSEAELQLTVDGQVERALGSGERVAVEQGPFDVALVRVQGQTFFRTVRKKLNWAARPPERS